MTRIEIEKRIEELERKEFMIHMIDMWTNRDRANLREVERELRELKTMVA